VPAWPLRSGGGCCGVDAASVQRRCSVDAAARAGGQRVAEGSSQREAFGMPIEPVAANAAFAALPQTQIYSAHAVVLVAVLQHGSPADALRVPPWLRDEPLEPSMQQRLDDGLARHGLVAG
jgi:hypothetical protein